MPMTLIRLDNISLSFGHYPLLDKLDLQINPGEYIGLIGRNGGGKSSLLRIIADEMKPDDGKVWRSPAIKLAYVSQEPALDRRNTIFQEVSTGLGSISQVLIDYHEASRTLSSSEEDIEECLVRLQNLQSELDAQDGWRIQGRVETLLHKLNLSEDDLIGNLSGGQKKWVALARALVSLPDVLLLDEPTNHLDFSSIERLEKLLKDFAGSVLFVTHDRSFIDNVATRIIELDRGILATYRCNFTEYKSKKLEIKEIEADHNQKFDKELAKEESWIRKGIQARRTRNEGRVRRLGELRKKRAERREQVTNINPNINVGIPSGRMVAELEHVSKSYGNKNIIKDFSCRIMRGNRVGFLGPNGAGKSTLLKLILNELVPDNGTVRHGTKLTVTYFDQMREQLNESATLIDTISQGSDFIEIGKIKKHIISYLEDFLFSPERARSPVKSLSGGERNRLLLARLFSRPTNILVLDEPTNDLDIETIELLEALLQDYTGTLLLASHDRTFLDNVVTQVIVFEGGGVLQEYVGGYEDWVRAKSSVKRLKEKKVQSWPINTKARSLKQASLNKLSYKETRELEVLPMRIEILELEQVNITNKLGDSVTYHDSPESIVRLQARSVEIEKEIMSCLTRWDELETKQLVAEQNTRK